MTDKGDFGRRTWDREEYAKLAQERWEAEKEKKTKGLTQAEDHVPISRDSLNFSANLNKRQVVTGEIVRTRGKAFGFYCEVCDLTFKDNLKFVDHLNSKPHLIRSGELNKDIHVTIEQVKERYDLLCKKLDASMGDQEKYDIKDRIEKRRKFEEEQKLLRKAKKQQKREEQTSTLDTKDPMAAMLGFSGFGSTKK